MGPMKRRVVPFVEDHRDCLVVQPADPQPPEVVASLQAVLKCAMQVEFQLKTASWPRSRCRV